jgi:hypothetical protein
MPSNWVSYAPRVLSVLALFRGPTRLWSRHAARDPGLYGSLTRRARLPNGFLTWVRVRLEANPDRSPLMTDLVYLALGTAAFLVFALAVRAADRM